VTCCTAEPGGRRRFLAAALGVVAAACAGPTADGSTKRERDLTRQGAAALGPIVDPHAHPGRFTWATSGELSVAAIDEMRAANVHCAFFAAVGDGLVIRREGGTGPIKNFRDPVAGELHQSTVGQLERVRRRGQSGEVRLVRGRADLAGLTASPAPGALLAIEGGDPLEGKVERVREFYELGVRSIQLMHFRVNELGDIQTEPPRHRRLTDTGASVVAEMNRLGMVVDGAHAAPETLAGILDVSRTPIIVSHTGPAALRPQVARHVTDDQMRAVAAKGGVVGIWPLVRRRPASLDGFFTDLKHARGVMGIDHVSFATDMTGMAMSTAILTYTEFAAVPGALLANGFTESEVRKITGANVLRVLDQALGG
jgi:membrane dipeptidase